MLKPVIDLTSLLIRHPAWFLGAATRGLATARAEGTARYKHHLPRLFHHRLDSRLERMAVEIGAASYVDHLKALIVTRFCKLVNAQRVLEIGTFRGGMTAHIARNSTPDCRIFTIDLPRQLLDALAPAMIPHDVDLAQMDARQVGSEWQALPERTKIQQLWGDSMTYDFSALAPFDLIYIDGSHAEPWVQKDTENAFAFLAPTGAILWDDALWSDVQRVLGRYTRSRPIYLFEDDKTAGYLQFEGNPVRIS
jgi:predicted O-methyltransferase YrrM